MIAPKFEVSAEVHVRAAAGATWQQFARLSLWPRWYPGVVAARWTHGEPWQEEAQMEVQVRNFLGAAATGYAVVRMCRPGEVAVWEMAMRGMAVVATARLNDELGGCRLTVRKAYHGPASLAMLALRGRHRRSLEQGLRNLKALIEGAPR